MKPDCDADFYRTGYEGYESLSSFPDRAALEAYRRLLLKKTELQVEFIARRFAKPGLRVIEFCCGNGRLLTALALRGLIEYGIGLEISQSRVAFAERWAADLGLNNIKYHVADVLRPVPVAAESYDLAVCITGAFSYFRPIRENAPLELLASMRNVLVPDGQLLIELYQMPARREQLLALSDNSLRLWHPLPPEDRFAYYLDDFQYFPDHHTLRHEKIFIGRNGSIDAGRTEMLAYYSHDEISSLLNTAGFTVSLADADFDAAPYQKGISETMVILSKKQDI